MSNNVTRFYLITFGLILTLAGATQAQQEKKRAASVRFKSGLTIVFTSATEPAGAGSKAFGSVQVMGEDNVVHRVFVDPELKVYFGYDLEVAPGAEAGQYKVSIRPLSVAPVVPPVRPHRSAAGASGGGGIQPSQTSLQPVALTALALPKYPEPQVIQEGDTLALDLLVNPQTGVKIIDLIRVSSASDSQLQPASASNGAEASGGGGLQPARDFTPETVELRMTASRLLVNGQVAIGEEESTRPGVTGALVWFYLPERGRFILSLVPRDGYNFQKIGVIEGQKLSFSLAGEHYEWLSTSPIVIGSAGSWHLWVMHDPEYRPDATLTHNSYLVGTASRIEHLLPKK